MSRMVETSPVIASELARTVLVKNYYYRVRMEAAQALINVSYAAFTTDNSTRTKRVIISATFSFSSCSSIFTPTLLVIPR
jgi:hypothetical protein